MSHTRLAEKEKKEVKLTKKRVIIFEDYTGTRPTSTSTPALSVRAQSELSGSTFYMMQRTRSTGASRPKLPLESRPVDDLILDRDSGPGVKSFHEVNKARLRDPSKQDELYFFKHNPPGSIVSELEAMAAGFYSLIAPHNVELTTAHYNAKGQHVGVSSKAIPGFQSLVDAPLTSDDFVNKKLLASLAVGLVTSHFFMEDDLHRGNIDKYGHRIDFDMSFWPIFSQFKDSGPIDWALRTPGKESCVITANDIRHFPNIVDTKPFYWPTNEAPVIREPLRTTVSKIIPISTNAYKISDNNLFRNLEQNAIFIHNKFKTYLKIALTDADMYHKIAQARVSNTVEVSGQKLIDVITTTQQDRIRVLRDSLSTMPEFRNFMKKNGEQVLAEIMVEFEDYNDSIKEQITKDRSYLDLLIHIPDVQKNYKALVGNMFSKAKQIRSFELTDSLFQSPSPQNSPPPQRQVVSAPGSLPSSRPPSERFTI